MKVQLGKKNESSKDPPEDSIFYYSFVHENMHLLEYVENEYESSTKEKVFSSSKRSTGGFDNARSYDGFALDTVQTFVGTHPR